MDLLQRSRPPNFLARARVIVSTARARCYHFKNRAARDKSVADHGPMVLSMMNRIALVRTNQLKPTMFQAVSIKLARYQGVEREPRPLRKPRISLYVVGVTRNLVDFATMVAQLAQIAPKGFRQPSSKSTKLDSTSLVEQAMIAAGQIERPKPYQPPPLYRAKVDCRELPPTDPKYLHAHARRRLAAQPMQEAA
jgi:hypothetical protein